MLKRSRWLLLKRPEKLTGEQRGRLAELVRRNLRTVRAYLLKEDFQSLWGYVSPYWAGQFLDRWCTRTMRSRLDPMKEVARMVALAPRPDSDWFRARGQFSSGVVEGFNGKARVITKRAYGSAPPGHWKSLCITHLATCPNQNSPTDSADEAFIAARSR